nr:MAG TPA: hypothetical protein [Caudoviricetes sp.]
MRCMKLSKKYGGLQFFAGDITGSLPAVVETSIRFGADALAKSYLGADALDRIYLGTDLLYQTLNEYTVTETLSNVTTIGTHPVKILEGKSLTLKYTADANYELPDSVTVANATSNWTKSTGTLVISNPTGDVTITITAVRITYSITENLTNVTKTGTHPSVIAAGQTLVLNYAAATGYNLPDTVTVTGATSDWKQATGVLTITNPTGAVTITIAGVQPKLAAPTNLSVSDDMLTFDEVANAEQYEVFAGSNSIGTYSPTVEYTLTATPNRSTLTVKVDGEVVTVPYTLTKSCTITIETTNGDGSGIEVNGEHSDSEVYYVTKTNVAYNEIGFGPSAGETMITTIHFIA